VALLRTFETLVQDAKFSMRVLRRNPGFALIAVLSLALGIGANTAIFTLIDTVLLRSLPVKEPDRLVEFALDPDKPSVAANYPDYEYIRDHNKSFDGVIAPGSYFPTAFEVVEGAHASAQVVTTTLVSGNYFQVLGVTPAVGRVFAPEDNIKEDGHPWAVLDYDFWQRRFAGDPRGVGKKITLNGSPFTIVGVARRGFTGVATGIHPDIYVPIMMLREINRSDRQWNNRHFWFLSMIGRLKPGVTMQAAIAEMDVLWKQILANDPERRPVPEYAKKDYEKRNRATLLNASGGYSWVRNQLQQPLMVLMVVVALVLLIACANVANLLLARAASRQREIAIRLAVGAGRARLIRQLVFETLTVSLAGGAAGVAVAWYGVRVLVAFIPQDTTTPVDLDLSLDWRLLAFTFGISVLVGLLCGIVPALQATRPDLTSALKNDVAGIGRVRFDLRRALVVAQVAISLLLLIGAGLFIRSLQNLRSLDPGFARENVLVVWVDPMMSAGYKGQRLRDFYDRLLERTQALPGTRAASIANVTPLGGARWNYGIVVEGYQRPSDEKPFVDFSAVSSDFFTTLGIPLLAGRTFRPDDNPPFTPDPDPTVLRPMEAPLGPPAPVAIVNETFAKHYFRNENAIGRHFSVGDKPDPARTFEIVGVVKDAKYFDMREAAESMVYVPSWRFHFTFNDATLCVRSTGRPEQLIGAIRGEIANLDPAIPVLQTQTMEDRLDNNISQERTVTTLCGFFGAVAVLLAAIGLYGVMAHAVTRRYREIGIRMALGAPRGTVLRLVLRDTALMIGIGAAIGLPAAFALTRLVQSFLYGLTPQDPASIVLATAGLIAVTGFAGYVPARRATKVDPMVALRYE
jgi:predicted permease